MKMTKFFVGAVAVAVVAIALAPYAEAQCPTARLFQSAGSMQPNTLRFSPAGNVNGDGNEIGMFWDTANAVLSNNFGGTCPSSEWWSANAADNGIISGTLTGGACAQAGCPGLEMTLVVEDYDAGGAPGIGGSAYFMAALVDETPAATRWYDYGRPGNNLGTNLNAMQEFPTVDVTASSRDGGTGNVIISATLVDPSPGIVSAVSGADVAVAPSRVLNSYVLLRSTGMADPGRDRTLWTQVGPFPYNDMGATLNDITVECDDQVNDTWLAVGLNFDGGAAGDVPSNLVGRAVQVECDPNLADPDGRLDLVGERPTEIQKTQPRPQSRSRR